MTKNPADPVPPRQHTDGSDNETRADLALAALADVAAALAGMPVAMIARSRESEPIFNASAAGADRDAIARWQPHVVDALPLEIGDLHERKGEARAQRLAAAAPALRFCLVLPLGDGGSERVATLCIADRAARRLTPSQRAGLVALTGLTPAADAASGKQEDPLRDLLANIVDRETTHRERLSGELHDGAMQWLAATRGALSEAIDGPPADARRQQLRQCRSLVDDTIAQLRVLQFELYPPLLRDFGLPEALRWLAGQMRDEHGLDCEVVAAAALPALDADLNGFLYFALRDLWLRCATRHSARRCVTNLTCADGQLEVVLRHDGAAGGGATATGRHISGLDAYLRHKGGTLQVQEANGGSQVIRLGLPLNGATSRSLSGAAEAPATSLTLTPPK